jgi:hypothetical protein
MLRKKKNDNDKRYVCLLGLYDECVVVKNKPELKTLYDENTKEFIRDICPLCIKVYRLKHGLKYVHEGERTGITL